MNSILSKLSVITISHVLLRFFCYALGIFFFMSKFFLSNLLYIVQKYFGSFPEGFLLTHFWPMFPFHTGWKYQKTIGFSDVFWGYKMGTLARNGLKKIRDFVIRHTLHLKLPITLPDCIFSANSFAAHAWPLKNEA